MKNELSPTPHHGAGAWLISAVALLAGFRAGSLLAADAEPTAAPSQAGALEEVVVTATKQATSVDVAKVPISISAYSERDLDAVGARSFADIADMTPGVDFSQQNQYGGTPQTNVEIRGIQSRSGAPTTGIYLDDTPLLMRANQFNTGGTPAFPQVFDLERVEVLRGPQGTLFGASAEGGAVRFIPNAPSLTTPSVYARAEASYTAYGAPSFEAGAAAGGPLVEGRLGYRVSAWYRQDGGWIDRCQPAVGAPGCLGLLASNVNETQSLALRAAVTWTPIDALRITPSVYYQRLHYQDGSGYELADSDPSRGRFVFAQSLPVPATDPLLIPSLKVEADLGFASLTSVTSYVWRRLDFQIDYTQYQDFAFFGNPYPLTGAPNDYAHGAYTTSLNNLYEELRLASSSPGSRIDWVAGVYAERARQVDHARIEHPDLPDLILTYYGKTIEQVLGVPPYLGRWVYWADHPELDEQLAVFGNFDVKIAPTLKLNLGARWATFKTDTSLFLAGPFNGGDQQFTGGADSSAFTPKAGLTWQPNETSTYYVSAGKGFRSSGVNEQTTSNIPTCHVEVPRTIRPDSLWSYEIGAKERLLDHRLAIDASAFYIEWRDIQNTTNVAPCGITAVLNLGSAVSKGFDLDIEALLSRALKVGLRVGYTDAYFKDTTVVPGLGQIVAAGETIAGASSISGPAIAPWSVSLTGEYDFTVLGHEAYASLQDLFHSRNDGPYTTKNPANALLYDPVLPPDPSTNLLNLRLGIRHRESEIALFINNALDAHPALSVNHALPGDPRFEAATFRPLTVGLSATLRR